MYSDTPFLEYTLFLIIIAITIIQIYGYLNIVIYNKFKIFIKIDLL